MNPSDYAQGVFDTAPQAPSGTSPRAVSPGVSAGIVRAPGAARVQRTGRPAHARAARKFFQPFLMFPLVAAMVIALASCQSAQHPPDDQFWDGALPLEQRETIENVQRTVLPAFHKLLDRLNAAGAGPFSELEGPSLTGRATDRETGTITAFEVSTAIGAAGAIPGDQARQVTNDIVSPLGLTHFTDVTSDDDNGDITYNWFDEENGGFVELTILAKGSMTVYYMSGLRPTDGSTVAAEQWLDGAQSDASVH